MIEENIVYTRFFFLYFTRSMREKNAFVSALFMQTNARWAEWMEQNVPDKICAVVYRAKQRLKFKWCAAAVAIANKKIKFKATKIERNLFFSTIHLFVAHFFCVTNCKCEYCICKDERNAFWLWKSIKWNCDWNLIKSNW